MFLILSFLRFICLLVRYEFSAAIIFTLWPLAHKTRHIEKALFDKQKILWIYHVCNIIHSSHLHVQELRSVTNIKVHANISNQSQLQEKEVILWKFRNHLCRKE